MTRQLRWLVAGILLMGITIGRAGASRTPIEKILEENIRSDLELVQALRSGKSERELDSILAGIERDLKRQKYALQ